MFDVEDVKRSFGNRDDNFYVTCERCPIYNDDEVFGRLCPCDCTGYSDAWHAIYIYLNGVYDRMVDVDSDNDAVNHPSHYNRGEIEVADFIYDQSLNFNLGNAIKYICRAGFKGDNAIEDLEKAIWYLNHELKMLKGCGE